MKHTPARYGYDRYDETGNLRESPREKLAREEGFRAGLLAGLSLGLSVCALVLVVLRHLL